MGLAGILAGCLVFASVHSFDLLLLWSVMRFVLYLVVAELRMSIWKVFLVETCRFGTGAISILCFGPISEKEEDADRILMREEEDEEEEFFYDL